jgi:DeoR family fructose operon transcriptional repressor
MKQIERHRQVLERLSERGSISVQELASSLGVSRMTINRDLHELHEQKRLRRVRGGAITADFRSFDPGLNVKSVINAGAKSQIARAAVERFIGDNCSIIVESGSTAAVILDFIVDKPGCRVFLNCVGGLTKSQAIGLQTGQVFTIPGVLKVNTLTFVGPEAAEYIARLNLDLCFISATGLSVTGELLDPDPMEIAVKRAMVNAAKRTVLLLDRTKFGRTSLFPVVPLGKIAACVTDGAVAEPFAGIFARQGIETIVA